MISLREFSYTTCFAPTTPTVVTLIPFHGNHWFWGGGCVTDPWRQVQVGRAVALQRLNVLVHPLGRRDDTCCLIKSLPGSVDPLREQPICISIIEYEKRKEKLTSTELESCKNII